MRSRSKTFYTRPKSWTGPKIAARSILDKIIKRECIVQTKYKKIFLEECFSSDIQTRFVGMSFTTAIYNQFSFWEGLDAVSSFSMY